ncbi:MAG TPA: ASCH/PUA domain-containing protein [Pseudonocardiaceae bacterium]|jgi:ASC-1-like (ASCH) protein
MAEHELKTWPEYFQAIKRGDKTFELRRNDRDFQVGDILRLSEWEPTTGTYSGSELLVRVTHLMVGGVFGLEPGFVALSITATSPALELAERGLRQMRAEMDADEASRADQ